MTNKGPEKSYRDGALSLAVFEGQYGKSIVVQKSYLKKGGNVDNNDDWNRSVINLFLNELPKTRDILVKACEELKDEIADSMIRK